MYCTHKECSENESGIVCLKERASNEYIPCPIRDELECCKDCSYQCKTSWADKAPTGCALADEELGYIPPT